MLAAGTGAAATMSAALIGTPVIAPAIRAEFDVSLSQLGVVLSGMWIGPLLTLLAWGLLADRIGERIVLATGIGLCGVFLAAAAFAPGWISLTVLLALAGAAGTSTNSASGRAVMAWFDPGERGLALGVRQAAIPLGGAVSALVLPSVVAAGGVEAAFLFLAGLCAAGALASVLVVRDRPGAPSDVEEAPTVLRDARLWRVALSGGFYLVAQVAVTGFVVLFLHDERGLSNGQAAAVLAAVQVLAVAARIGAGRWSDVVRSRVRPLRVVGLASAVALAATAALLDASLWIVLPAFVVAGTLSMAWNGLAFTAAAELAGARRSGAAIGFQQTVLSGVGAVVPAAFALAVTATSWQLAFAGAALFPLVGWLGLRPLAGR
ncbi:MAG TPA: MFS transporter [Gaiellaceae bacterium]|nr:MFS transporter [Gaiellaceae bacterium]